MNICFAAYVVVPVLFHNAWAATVDCSGECPRMMSAYNISCSATGTGNLLWFRGSTRVLTCITSSRTCAPEVFGYNGFQINDTFFILEIEQLDQTVNDVNWSCQLGTDTGTCSLTVIEDTPSGTLKAGCIAVGDDGHKASCSGLTSIGNPSATLELMQNGVMITSTNTSLTLEATIGLADNANITAFMKGQNSMCLLPQSTFICPDTQPSKKSGLAFVIITLILLILGIIAIVVVAVTKKDENKEKLRLVCLIFGALWIIFGLIGTIVVLVIGSQIQPGSVLPAGTITVVGLVLSVITLLAGLVILLVAGCLLSGKNLKEGKTEEGNKQAQNQPLQDGKGNTEEDKSKQKQGEKGKSDEIGM